MTNDTISITRVELNSLLIEAGKKACRFTLDVYRTMEPRTPASSADKLIISSIAAIVSNIYVMKPHATGSTIEKQESDTHEAQVITPGQASIETTK